MIFRLLAVLAEFERDQTAERTRLALRFKRERGERWCNDAPYGYEWNGAALRARPAEQQVIRHAARLRREGMTIRAIAERLREAGVRNRLGRPFPFQRIATMLRDHGVEVAA
jgi:site-specific DNA recombinase